MKHQPSKAIGISRVSFSKCLLILRLLLMGNLIIVLQSQFLKRELFQGRCYHLCRQLSLAVILGKCFNTNIKD